MAGSDTDLIPPPQRVLLKHSEVMASALASRSRPSGGGTWFSLGLLALLCLAVWGGHLIAFWLVQQLPFAAMLAVGPWLPVVVPAYLSLVAVQLSLSAERLRLGRAWLKRMARVGIPLEREATYEVTPDALVLHTKRVTIAARWYSIDTVERGRFGWVISADQLHMLVPFADFPDEAAQRVLVSSIIQRMTAEARARSADAVSFAEVATSS